MDKHKDIGIRLENFRLLKLSKEVMLMAENDSDLLNAVYREISEKLGMDTAMEIYQMFKGQQISFPMRFFNPARYVSSTRQESSRLSSKSTMAQIFVLSQSSTTTLRKQYGELLKIA